MNVTLFEASLATLPQLEDLFVQFNNFDTSDNTHDFYLDLLKEDTNKLVRIGIKKYTDYDDYQYYLSSCDAGTKTCLQTTLKACNKVKIHGLPGLLLTKDILESIEAIAQRIETTLIIDQNMDHMKLTKLKVADLDIDDEESDEDDSEEDDSEGDDDDDEEVFEGYDYDREDDEEEEDEEEEEEDEEDEEEEEEEEDDELCQKCEIQQHLGRGPCLNLHLNTTYDHICSRDCINKYLEWTHEIEEEEKLCDPN